VRLSLGWEMVFGALALLAVAPLFCVAYPPLQDLPQHLAAVRVLHDFSSPEYRFQEFFELQLGRTQYLTFYLVAHLFAYAFGVLLATKLVVAAGIVGLPYAMRYLLLSLGRDQRLALFVLPLTWNAHLALGLFNFVCAIPLALVGLGLAVRLRGSWSMKHAVGLALIALVTFYTHVVPFGFLLLGAVLVAIADGVDATIRRLVPLLPALAASAYWMRENPAGGALRSLVVKNENVIGPSAEYQSMSALLARPGRWLTDILRSQTDSWLLGIWLALFALAIVAGWKAYRMRELRLELLAPLAIVAYFVTPSSYDWIWPINGRFPLLACVFALLWLRTPPRFSMPLCAAVALVSASSFVDVSLAFRKFQREERGPLEAAIATIPPGQKLVGLIWDKSSRQVYSSPFVHTAALYQATRGGAVMFTFADSPQSPFRFKKDNRPERVAIAWEWEPESVDPARDLGWFDWAITRGGPGSIRHAKEFELVFEEDRWSVYRRVKR
jgi:hypothetical protein